jgi:hypothetical protein
VDTVTEVSFPKSGGLEIRQKTSFGGSTTSSPRSVARNLLNRSGSAEGPWRFCGRREEAGEYKMRTRFSSTRIRPRRYLLTAGSGEISWIPSIHHRGESLVTRLATQLRATRITLPAGPGTISGRTRIRWRGSGVSHRGFRTSNCRGGGDDGSTPIISPSVAGDSGCARWVHRGFYVPSSELR